MAEDAVPVRAGGCLCGAVRFTARVPKARMHACHCAMCRRWVGGVMLSVDVEDLSFADGAPVKRFASSAWGERLSCADCGTRLGWRMRDGSYDSVSAYAFDEPLEATLTLEVFVDEKPAGYAFAGDTRKMTGEELVALFAGKGD